MELKNCSSLLQIVDILYRWKRKSWEKEKNDQNFPLNVSKYLPIKLYWMANDPLQMVRRKSKSCSNPANFRNKCYGIESIIVDECVIASMEQLQQIIESTKDVKKRRCFHSISLQTVRTYFCCIVQFSFAQHHDVYAASNIKALYTWNNNKTDVKWEQNRTQHLNIYVSKQKQWQ